MRGSFGAAERSRVPLRPALTSQAVIAAPDPGQAEPLAATVAERTLTCTEPSVAELASFRDAWFAELHARRVERFT